MNKTIIACTLAAMMIGGVAYANEAADMTGKTSTTVKAGRQKAAANIKAMDQDGDGSISKSEATGKIAKHFAKIDTDGNSSLSSTELKAMKHHKQKKNGENSQVAGKG